jgi:hypothetical protein
MTTSRPLVLAAALVALAAAPAGAHQRQLLQVGAADYLFVIGSLNEPVHTGDKSGIDLTVLAPDPSAPLDSRAPGAKPVEGLERTLRVEVKAGRASKVYALKPAYRNPGKYETVFYPTVATTFAYRVFGTLGGAPFDVTFTCNPTGHVQLEDRAAVELAGGVTRKGIVGTFGCPVDRAEAEFPPRR